MKERAQLMPMITVDSVDQARNFYVDKLGFTHMMGVLGKDGQFSFCTVVFNGAKVMLTRAEERTEATAPSATKRQVEIYFEVEDVNAYHDELKKKGLRIMAPLTDQWWGDRTFTVMDPYGYVIWFYQTVAEPVPPPGAKVV